MTERIEPNKIAGNLSGAGLRLGIVVSRFNSFITERLLEAALDALTRGGAKGDDVDVVHVPGSFELPLAAKKMAGARRPRALLANWGLLPGETPPFCFISPAASPGPRLSAITT